MCCNRCSGMEDRESSPMIMDVCKVAKENSNFRKSVWTGKCMQMTLMSIPPRGEIGLEVHEKTDQMIRVEQGRGIAMMGNASADPTWNLRYVREMLYLYRLAPGIISEISAENL